MTTHVLFIQGGGKGAHRADAPLAESLKRALGHGYQLHYPRMPDEDDPYAAAWQAKIADELAGPPEKTVVVGHSLGGSFALKCLAAQTTLPDIAGLYVLAAPSWDEDRWRFDELRLPDDLGDRLSAIPRIVLYQCRDDEIVPFAHLALHAKRLPQATVRAIDTGGHQFGEDLGRIADDIRGGNG